MELAPDHTDPVAPAVMGLPLDHLVETQLIYRVFDDIEAGLGGWVVTPNVDILRRSESDPDLKALLARATLRITDGAPIEWAGRLSGQRMPPRIPGASLLWTLSAAAAVRGVPVLLLGGRDGAAAEAASQLSNAFPGLEAHHHCPPLGFEHDSRLMAEVHEAIQSSGARVVFCGLGFPKQERLMDALHSMYPHVWFFGFGAAIDFASGQVSRAPEWMQQAGVEWTFRLATEPRRLARRYLVEDLPFSARMVQWALRRRAIRSLLAPDEVVYLRSPAVGTPVIDHSAA